MSVALGDTLDVSLLPKVLYCLDDTADLVRGNGLRAIAFRKDLFLFLFHPTGRGVVEKEMLNQTTT